MLTIAATPIGSVEEASLQLYKVLHDADIILAEDTRSFHHFYAALQSLYAVLVPGPVKEGQKVISYYKDIEFSKLPEILEYVHDGKHVVLVSEAGTPLASDPGHLLVQAIRKNGLPYTSVPGPTAFVAAGVLSGSSFSNFLFKGFLPKKPSDLRRSLQEIASFLESFGDGTVAFYESPHRINATLKKIAESMSEVTVTVCREINKKYEEVDEGKPLELSSHEYKGEITVILKMIRSKSVR